MRLIHVTALSALALPSCTRSVEADVQSMCSAIVEVMEGEAFEHVAHEDRDTLVMEAMAESISTAELVNFIGELGALPMPARQPAVAEFAATHGFEWNCPDFDGAFVLMPVAPPSEEQAPAPTEEATPTPPAAEASGEAAPTEGSADSAPPSDYPATGSGQAADDPAEAEGSAE